MEREIKFRAWDLIKKEYVYLSDILSSIPYYELFCNTPDNRAIELEQFTGLQDKNGRDIYEGDICKYTDEEATWEGQPIVFDRGNFCFECDYPNPLHEHPLLEVVSNIHEVKNDN